MRPLRTMWILPVLWGLFSMTLAWGQLATNAFLPVADTYASEQNPTTTYGTATFLNMRDGSGTDFKGYLRFDTSALAGRDVVSATLSMYCWRGAHTLLLYDVTDNTWLEQGLTWNTAPAFDSLLYTRAVGDGVWEDFDVLSSVSTPGLHSFGLQSTGNSYRRIDSREGSNVPVLELIFTNQAPTFSGNPIHAIDAVEYVPYNGSIASLASDPDGDALFFSKISGPAWMGVNADGSLHGAPGAAQVGTNDFVVQVTDGFGEVDTTTLHLVVVDDGGVAYSTLWTQYVDAKAGGSETTLPDFSYAGYRHGDEPIPTVDWTVFDVTSYGAVPDDGLSDKAAIESAIAAAEANGSGIVFFPPGRFEINKSESPWSNNTIDITASRIVLRGSGSGVGGTELYAERHMDPSDINKLYSCPYMIRFLGNGQQGTSSAVVADADRETHTVTVANASNFQVGDWVQLHRVDTSTAAIEEAVAPHPVEATWTSLINNGVVVDEHHLITSISGNDITFKEPIHSTVTSTGNWSVILFDALEEVGVEDIAFKGNWMDTFGHHDSFYADSGWSGVQFNKVVNSWMRRCRFTDWSRCATAGNSATVTMSDLLLDGNKGHNSVGLANSAHCLVFNVIDTANHHHACGVSSKCSGNVFLKCTYSSDTCFESHASQPRHTLLDNITGGWMYGRWGGASGNMPNHLENLVIWNYENTSSEKITPAFEFMRSGNIFGRIIMPYVIGFHGKPQAFDASMIALLESNGTAVEPASLYEAQYKLRKGKAFAELLYSEWAVGFGLSGTDSDYTSDPDGDMRNNLFEYGLGGIPILPSNSVTEVPQFGMVTDGGFTGLEYIYARRLGAEPIGLSYSVEFAEDLTNHSWSNAGIIETSGVLDEQFEAVTNRVPSAGTSNGFLRLNVEIED